MSGKTLRFFSVIACAAVLLPLAGCAIVTDMINPDFLTALGVDPDTVIASAGTIIIAFQNSTTGVADFGATVATSSSSTTDDLEYVYARDVAADETRTMVVDCPLATVVPGATISGTEAVAIVTGGNVDATVTYAGAELVEGVDFVCGDVIEIRIVETGTDAEDLAVELQVQVLPGS